MRGLILCAGLGERLRPITASVAKPAVRFLNIPMLSYPLFWLEQLKLDTLVINTHYLPETVEKTARAIGDWSYDLKFSHEPQILGSGGAIWKAREYLKYDNEFVTANGDAVFFFNHTRAIKDMLAFHQRTKPLATLLVCEYPGVGETIPGVWVNSRGNAVQFGKGPGPGGAVCRHYTGVAIFSERIFEKLPEGSSNILYDVLYPEIQKGEIVSVWNENMRFYETGNPQSYLQAQRECLEMLFTTEAATWHLTDVLDRFSPGWRNYSDEHLLAFERPKFKYSTLDQSKILLADGIHSSTDILFEGLSVLGANLDLSGRTNTEGVYLPEGNIWVR